MVLWIGKRKNGEVFGEKNRRNQEIRTDTGGFVRGLEKT